MFGSRSHMRLGHFEDEEIILLNERIVERRHSKLAWHSAISGASTELAFSAVRPNAANLSIFAPVVLPILTTMFVRAVVGRLITHSRLWRIISKL